MPPAAAIDDLLICQHGRALGAPVHKGLLAIGEAALVHAEEEPLIPAIVFRFACCDFAIPIKRETQSLKALLHVRNILQGPLARLPARLQCRILGGQSKRIPAHRVQDIVAAHAHETSQCVADRVITGMPHVQLATWIGEHLEHVILLAGILRRLVQIGRLLPAGVPLLFDFLV